jgi:hypothetical protein
MAHPKRRAQVLILQNDLLAQGLEATVTWDRIGSEWDTGRRAMEAGIGQGEWHLVLQDDALITPHFGANLHSAIAAAPSNCLISLYTGQVRPLPSRVIEAVSKAPDGSWLRFYTLMWGVGLLIPSDHIEPMLEFTADPQYAETPYDSRIGLFYNRNRLPVYYTMPSLVDHADHLGSLLEHDYEPDARKAHRVANGLIHWNDQVTDI